MGKWEAGSAPLLLSGCDEVIDRWEELGLEKRGLGPVLGARGPEIAIGLEVRDAAEQGLLRA